MDASIVTLRVRVTVCRAWQEKKRIVCMLVLIMLLFAVSWFPFFTVQLYFVTDDTAHRSSTIRTTAAILQLLGYRFRM